MMKKIVFILLVSINVFAVQAPPVYINNSTGSLTEFGNGDTALLGSEKITNTLVVSGSISSSRLYSSNGVSTTGLLTASSNASVTGNLTVSGTISAPNLSISTSVSTSRFYAQYGTNSAPSYTFAKTTNTGMYSGSGSELQFTVQGNLVWQFQGNIMYAFYPVEAQNGLDVTGALTVTRNESPDTVAAQINMDNNSGGSDMRGLNVTIDSNGGNIYGVYSSVSNIDVVSNMYGGYFDAVNGTENESYGVYAHGSTYGVYGVSDSYGVFGSSSSIGVFGSGAYGIYGSGSSYAAWLQGGTYALYSAGGLNYFNGNVGIGVSSPTAPLVVSGIISATKLWTSQGVSASTIYSSTSVSSPVGNFANLTVSNSITAPTIYGSTTISGTTGRFGVITTTGNVGIGTLSAASALNVNGTIRSIAAGIPVTGAGAELFYTGGSSTLLSYDRTGAAYNPLNIDSSNTTIYSRSNPVTIKPGSTAVGTAIYSSDGSTYTNIISTSNGSEFYNNANAGTPHLVINSVGNVGINTTSPTAKFTVSGATSITGNLTSSLNISGQTLSATNLVSSANISLTGNETISGSLSVTGSVGLGTPSPASKLHIYNGSSGNNNLLNVPNGPVIVEGSGNTYISLMSPAANLQGYLFGSPTSVIRGGIYYNHSSDLMSFVGGGNNTRIAIQSDGNVGIGTTTPGDKLVVQTGKVLLGPGNYNNGYYIGDSTAWGYTASHSGSTYYMDTLFYGVGDSNRGWRVVDAGYGSGEKIRVDGTGNFSIQNDGYSYGGTGWINASDIRLKKDITPIQNALEKILKLRGVNFKWRKHKGRNLKIGNNLGLIAQEVQQVIPEVVVRNGDGYYGVAYEKLVPLLIEAIKEQDEENKAIMKRLDKLEGK